MVLELHGYGWFLRIHHQMRHKCFCICSLFTVTHIYDAIWENLPHGENLTFWVLQLVKFCLYDIYNQSYISSKLIENKENITILRLFCLPEMPIFRIYSEFRIFGHKKKKFRISKKKKKKKNYLFIFFLDNICRKLYKMAKKWKLGWGDPVNCAYRMRFFASKMSKIFLKGGFAPSARNLYAIEINFLFFLIFFHTLLASLVYFCKITLRDMWRVFLDYITFFPCLNLSSRILNMLNI